MNAHPYYFPRAAVTCSFLFSALGIPILPTYNDFQYKQKIKLDPKNEITIVGLGAIDQFNLNLEDDTSEYQQYLIANLLSKHSGITHWVWRTNIIAKKGTAPS